MKTLQEQIIEKLEEIVKDMFYQTGYSNGKLHKELATLKSQLKDAGQSSLTKGQIIETKENKLMQCNLCRKIWQTHECGEISKRCPECGSAKKTDMVKVHGNRLFTSHILTLKAYNEIIFGSEQGRTWHTEFGKIKGDWIKKHKI